jgi:hypothetical protein
MALRRSRSNPRGSSGRVRRDSAGPAAAGLSTVPTGASPLTARFHGWIHTKHKLSWPWAVSSQGLFVLLIIGIAEFVRHGLR